MKTFAELREDLNGLDDCDEKKSLLLLLDVTETVAVMNAITAIKDKFGKNIFDGQDDFE